MVTKDKIDEAAAILDGHLGPGIFNYDGDYIIIIRSYNVLSMYKGNIMLILGRTYGT